MRFRLREHETEASMDLTNLIDVVLLLIIFFMLTAQFAEAERRAMDLPRERGDEAPAEGTHVMLVDVDADGRMWMLGREADVASIARAASEARDLATGGMLNLLVRADRRCPASHLNRLARALAAAGVRSWRLGTAPDGAPPAGGAS